MILRASVRSTESTSVPSESSTFGLSTKLGLQENGRPPPKGEALWQSEASMLVEPSVQGGK
jgi:hypothetical protein